MSKQIPIDTLKAFVRQNAPEFLQQDNFRESEDGPVRAKGYVLTQRDLLNQIEVLELPEFRVYEVPIGEIGSLTGLILTTGTQPQSVRGRARTRASEGVTADRIRLIQSSREIAG